MVQFPDDGHPDMANAVLDLTGDCRDEIVVWNPRELWVYTQDDSPKTGRQRGLRRAAPGSRCYLWIRANGMLSIRARAARVLVTSGVKSLRRLPIEQRRARIERLARRFSPPGGTVVRPLDASGLDGEWVSVPATRANRVILYLHGGAFCIGSPASHRKLVAQICAEGAARALSLDYRLAPEHPFPAAIEDAVQAYRHLRKLGIPAGRVAFAGDSAGGNIALAALILLRDAGEPLPAAAVCISPPTDLTGQSESLASRARLDPLVSVEAMVPLLRAYVGDAQPSNPLLSPLLADLRGLPPLLIQVGSREILHDDSLRFAQKASEAGVDVTLEVGKQLWHVWHAAAPYVPEANAAIRRIGQFLRERIPDGPSPSA